VSVSTEERAEWVVQVPALTFLNGEKDDGRGGWPLYGMEVGEILKSLSCKSRTVERSLVTGGRRGRGGDTAAMYLLSGVDMTATGFVPVAYREHGPCIDSLARNTKQTGRTLDLGQMQSRRQGSGA
jgi:hypothetical protein